MIHYLEPDRPARMAEVTTYRMDVSGLTDELDRQPELWNEYTERTKAYADGPHAAIDDIWVRYNARANLDPSNPVPFFCGEHDSSWYPAYAKLPALRPIIFGLMALVEGERLGGVLITRIPPGHRVGPHKDEGWHARYYRKFAVQVRGGPDQYFCFQGESLVAEAGEVYEFDNSQEHWVVNDSERERITLIVCIRTGD